MSLKHGLLGLLNYGKMSGYELDKVFNDSLEFFWQGQTSQIYRELNAMEKMGWLQSEIEFQTDKPNKKNYEITEAGKKEFAAWLTATDSAIAEMLHVRSSFLMRLFFADAAPIEQTAEMLRDYRDKSREALQKMAGAPVHSGKYSTPIANSERAEYWQMVASFGTTYYAATEQWASKTLARIEKMKTENENRKGEN